MDSKAPENFTVVDSYSLASPFERIIAFIIDILLYAILLSSLYLLCTVVNMSWISGILSGLYLVLRDSIGFLNYQSVGKKIMKLRVIYNNDGMKISLSGALKRNFIFLPNLFYSVDSIAFAALSITLIFILIEMYLLYSSTDHQRLGDQFADTIVIENYF